MPNHRHETYRDRTRQPEARESAQSRKAARHAKSARLFLSFAFPADLSAFQEQF